MSEHKTEQGHSAQHTSAGGYTPAPVRKTRTVTGSHEKIGDVAPLSVASGDDVDEYAQYARDSRPSIQINLNTINETTQIVAVQELEEQAKLAEFSPLSGAPINYQPTSANDSSTQWPGVTPFPDALTPPQGAYQSDRTPDLYKSRRRSLMVLITFLVLTGWFIGMATQIGVSRLLDDPYGETMSAITGKSYSTKRQDQQRKPSIQTSVNITEGRAVARVLSIEPLKRGIFAIRGVVLNESSQALETVLLTLTLRSPDEARTPWVKQFEFACCQQPSFEGLSDREIDQLLATLAESSPSLDERISLDEGRSVPFTFIADLSGRKVKLKRGVSPRADIEVNFFE